ncbi:hypothetical protein ACFLVI_01435 [Chloroflexota bacterium]
MSRLRLTYIGMLIALGALIAFTVFGPFALGDDGGADALRAQVLATDDEWIVEIDIMNDQGEDLDYIIEILVDDRLYTEDILISEGRQYTYIHHIRTDSVGDGEASFVIYEAGDPDPVKQWTFYLR